MWSVPSKAQTFQYFHRLKFISMSLEKMTNGSLKEFKRRVTRGGHGLGRAQDSKETWDHWETFRISGGGWCFLFSSFPKAPQSQRPPRDAINTDSSSGPFDTFAFEGPGRESSLYVVRINALYTQTINSSMDLPAPWKARPYFPGPLGLYSIP